MMTEERAFRVDISRPLRPKRIINGLEVYEDSGLNYVDCYFPDGSQRTWGYIGRDCPPGSVFAPLAGIKQSLCDAIQAEINKLLGCTAENAADAPQIIEYPEDTVSAGDEGEDDEEEGEESE